MNALEMEEWRKVRKKKGKVARPNDKLMVRARVIYNRKILDRTGRSRMSTYRLRVLAGQRDALLIQSNDSVNLDTFDDGGSGQGRRAAPL